VTTCTASAEQTKYAYDRAERVWPQSSQINFMFVGFQLSGFVVLVDVGMSIFRKDFIWATSTFRSVRVCCKHWGLRRAPRPRELYTTAMSNACFLRAPRPSWKIWRPWPSWPPFNFRPAKVWNTHSNSTSSFAKVLVVSIEHLASFVTIILRLISTSYNAVLEPPVSKWTLTLTAIMQF